jgi:hypothetical protein
MSETPETKKAKNYIAQIADHQDRFVYKGNYYDVENCINAVRQRDEAVLILQNVYLMIDELLSQDGYVSQKTMIEVGEDIGSFLATLDRTEKP